MMLLVIERREYRQIFLDTNGQGPWPCYLDGCDDLVQPDELLVHHIDEDPTNNNPANLVSMHHACHTILHRRGKPGKPRSPETRAKIAEAKRGVPLTEEHKLKLSAILSGRPGRSHSAESRQKMSQTRTGQPKVRRRYRCGGCSVVTTSSGLASHQKSSGHAGQHEEIAS